MMSMSITMEITPRGYGYWRILVATHDGALLESSPNELALIAEPDGEGPYR